MARPIRKILKAVWGREQKALREEFNKLVGEVEELRAQLALHEHAALNAAPSVLTLAAPETNQITIE